MKSINLTNIQEAGTNNRLPAGGYVCKYTNVNDVADKEYLYMEFDIAEGPYKDYFKGFEESAGFWGGRCYRSYKEKALPMFKRMCSAVSKSNTGFIFDGGEQNNDEKTLIGKYVGIVLQEEEYIGNDGNVKTRLNVSYECDIEKIRNKSFKIPDRKRLPEAASAEESDFMKIDDSNGEETPFN